VLAIGLDKRGEIELYTMVRAGTLSFSLPTSVKSESKTSVAHMQWAADGKTLLCSNRGKEGIRILSIESHSDVPPGTSRVSPSIK
jgi:hypothetical protein